MTSRSFDSSRGAASPETTFMRAATAQGQRNVIDQVVAHHFERFSLIHFCVLAYQF